MRNSISFGLWLISLQLMLSIPVFAGSYTSTDGQCDGFARLPVVTQDGTCLGLVASRSTKIPFKMPRTLVQTPDDKLLVVDMGGWVPNKGQLLALDYRNPNAQAEIVLSKLNLPHKILQGADGKIYLSEAHRIQRFSWVNGAIADVEVVIDNLPFATEYLHPLKNFAFDEQSNLLVNIGSSSDRCDKKFPLADCVNGKEASIRRYKLDKKTNKYSTEFEVVARGLRNSMALVVHPTGTILQAENSIDLPDAEEPYEEINIIANNKFYGWPLCVNNNISLAGSGCAQADYQQPWTLLPPHVAPLDMLYYSHTKLPSLHNKLLMSWHGYRIAGNRLVSYNIDANGRPELQKNAVFWRAPVTPEGKYTQHTFAPKGGWGVEQKDVNNKKVAQHNEVISQWHEIPGLRPEGAPVGLTQARDGSIFIVDDRNAAILRLSAGPSYQAKKVIAPQSTVKSIVPPSAISAIFQRHCTQCHTELAQQQNTLLTAANWLNKQNGKTLIAIKVFDDKTRPMPPEGNLTAAEKKTLADWLLSI
ncbi:MAG: PQQ-dependent sugar dehydrogenase [Cellvibrio sp.]|uniref:PQQ-dependent sugar dehydrogenase n=1 Tax=Cellvibrio sp. TaxID=1965322 RepID=UPI0031A3EB57